MDDIFPLIICIRIHLLGPMDATLLLSCAQASASERTHTTIILNHEGNQAKPGDLLVAGPNDDTTKAAVLLKIHKEDPNRVLVIHNSSGSSLWIACKGNGTQLARGLPTKDLAAKVEDLTQLPIPIYSFANCRVTDQLSPVQIEQASQLAVETTVLWSCLHQCRVTGRNVHIAATLWRNQYLPALKQLGHTIQGRIPPPWFRTFVNISINNIYIMSHNIY